MKQEIILSRSSLELIQQYERVAKITSLTATSSIAITKLLDWLVTDGGGKFCC